MNVTSSQTSPLTLLGNIRNNLQEIVEAKTVEIELLPQTPGNSDVESQRSRLERVIVVSRKLIGHVSVAIKRTQSVINRIEGANAEDSIKENGIREIESGAKECAYKLSGHLAQYAADVIAWKAFKINHSSTSSQLAKGTRSYGATQVTGVDDEEVKYIRANIRTIRQDSLV